MSQWWSLIKETVISWVNHKAAGLGAALAFYSVFSLGPLIVIAVAIAGLVFGQDAVRGEVGAQLRGFLDDSGADAARQSGWKRSVNQDEKCCRACDVGRA
jgi:membrane protein